MRFALCLALTLPTWLIACGGNSRPASEPAPTPITSHVAVELIPVTDGKEAGQIHVDVVVTGENGSNQRARVGTFVGPCKDVSAAVGAENMSPRLGVDCGTDAVGVRLRMVATKGELVVLRARIDAVTPASDPSYDRQAAITLPYNGRVITDHDDH